MFVFLMSNLYVEKTTDKKYPMEFSGEEEVHTNIMSMKWKQSAVLHVQYLSEKM